jgi:hypothetical protein
MKLIDHARDCRTMDMKSKFLSLTGTLLLVLGAGSGQADDTDIYVNSATPTDSEPLVMFSLDYRPNLGSTACNGDECDGLIARSVCIPSSTSSGPCSRKSLSPWTACGSG